MKKKIEIKKLKIELLKINSENLKLKKLISINSYITNSLNKKEILKRILQEVEDLLSCKSSSLLLIDKKINKLKFEVLSEDSENDVLKNVELSIGEGVAGTVWEKGIPMVINNPQDSPVFSILADKSANTMTKSIIAVPLVVDGEIIGVIEAINKKDGKFIDFDLSLLQYISTQSAIAIKNADLFNMAIKDGMTDLFINKYFKERLVLEIARARRYKTDLSLVMFDIDYFKRFNDNYGHQIGDIVLKKVASVIKENCRNMDIPCRYGGEEFSVILPETGRKNALVYVERVRSTIEKMVVEYADLSLKVTISAGYVTFPAVSFDNSVDFIDMADNALYCSKKNGRNRISFYNQ